VPHYEGNINPLLYSRQKSACIKLFFSATGLIASIIDRLVEDKDYFYNGGEEHNIYSVVIISKKKSNKAGDCVFISRGSFSLCRCTE